MAETETIRVYKPDKERLNEMAESRGVKVADVVSEHIREPAYLCPECDDPFDPEEVDPDSVREHGVMTTSVDKLVKGERDVKDFECPCCEARVKPQDIETATGDVPSREELAESGDTGEDAEGEFSTEEA
jgi:hypothetical protein